MGRYDDPQTKSPFLAIIGIAAAIIAGGAIWWLISQDEPDKPKPVSVNQLPLPLAESVIEASNEAAVESGSPFAEETGKEQESDAANVETDVQLQSEEVLPPLQDSDGLFRQQVTALSPDLAELLQADGLIEKYLQIVNDFSEGQRLYKHIKFLSLSEPFVAGKDDDGLYMSARNYRRYDRLAQGFVSIDAKQAMMVYRKLRPLLQQVYAEFSYPVHYQLEDLFKKAASEVIAAPVIESRIALVRPTVRYKFIDKDLEALSPVQKQMLRMGPENTRIIQQKLRELVQEMAGLQVE